MPTKTKRTPTVPDTEDEMMEQALEEMDAEINQRDEEEIEEASAEAPALQPEPASAPKGEPEVRGSGAKRYIIKSHKVDKFNTVRRRVELTPAICDMCGFDIAETNNLGDYYSMSETMQEQVKRGIEEHKKAYHSAHQKLIVDEDEKPTEWLGKAKF